MAKWDTEIDGNHLKIAAHGGSTMRVVAGPGTGKSYAIQRRVMRLLEEKVDPKRILAVTFTNVAADALRKDLNSLKIDGATDVAARTLHSLCFSILRKEDVFKHLNREPRPLMAFEERMLIEDLQGDFDGIRETEKLLDAYQAAFARLQQEEPGVLSSARDQEFKQRLLGWLTYHKAMLIGEVIPLTYEYLKLNPESPEFDQYDFILVDEYQDLNKAEQALVDLLAKKAELLIVGDEDQSIYRFKHAHPNGINEFHETHTPLEDVTLQVCRRCPKKVVKLANQLMGYSLNETHPKKLHEFEENEDGEVFAVQWPNLEEEALGVSKVIKELIANQGYGVKPEDILVLSPRRTLGYLLKDVLQNNFAISSHTFFQEEALETEKAQKAFALYNYIVNPDDRVALRILLGTPTPLPGSYKALIALAQSHHLTPRELLIEIAKGSIEAKGLGDIPERFRVAEHDREQLKDLTTAELIDKLFNADIPEGIEVILSLISTISYDEETDKETFFTKLRDRIRLPEVTDEKGFVRIMTLHKSKGLTSKVVFVLGCVGGLVPTIKDEEKLREQERLDELEALFSEARRLFFVALTRSKKYLFLSSFRELSFRQGKQLPAKFTTGTNGKARTLTSPFMSDLVGQLPEVLTGTALLAHFGINE